MNLFILDSDPATAANMICLKNICRMILESAQMLSMSFEPNVRGLPYPNWNGSQYNHPCTIWTRQTFGNWAWVYSHGLALCSRYNEVYGRQHLCNSHFAWFANNYIEHLPSEFRNSLRQTPHVQCVPEEYKINDSVNPTVNAVSAYRKYYIREKASFAKWENLSAIPIWWPERTNRFVRI